MINTESVILRNLIYSEEYTQRVLPFLSPDYFIDPKEKLLFEVIGDFIGKYNKTPSPEALSLIIDAKTNITDEMVKDVNEYIADLKKNKDEQTDEKWLLDITEKFCRDKALYNAVRETISIMDGKSTKAEGIIPELLTNALAISFDPNVGHDYLENAEERYEFYHKKEKRLDVGLEYFSKITRGGFPTKTLNIFLAGTGVGKTLAMCHFTADFLSQGFNVLYITAEMAQERIAERIDANLMNTPINELETMSKDLFFRKVNAIKSKTQGKLVIKEYPTASASAVHFRSLINELNLKKKFRPQVIFIDYLNICCSSRLKHGNNVNSYSYIKAIAEEFRGLAVEFDVPLFTATQTTRTGFNNSDPELTDTSESFGVPATADFMCSLVNTEELEQLNRIQVKQLKNRYNDPAVYRRFMVGVDKSKMMLYNISEDEQDMDDAGHPEIHISVNRNKPVMDKTEFGEREFESTRVGRKFNEKFGSLKT